MIRSCSDLFDLAGQASSNGFHTEAIQYLDQCICSNPTYDLAVQAYCCLYSEIFFGMRLMENVSPGSLTQDSRKWCLRGAECNSRTIQVYRFYSRAGNAFQGFFDKIIDKAEKDVIMLGMFFALHQLDASLQEKSEALLSPLRCLAVPWDKLEIRTPGN